MVSKETFKALLPQQEWRGSLTLYASQWRTRPCGEHDGVSFSELCEVIAPSTGPQCVPDKGRVCYFTPGLLKDAPLVGKTLKKALAAGEPPNGKQRSARHVTCSTFLVFDLDGASREQVQAIGKRLKQDGVSALIYTTYSHGNPVKPGHRLRVILPVDAAMNLDDYSAAWACGNQRWFGSMADPSGAKLYQAQGVWATHPERAERAGRRIIDGGIASLPALLANSPEIPAKACNESHQMTDRSLHSADKARLIEQIRLAIPFLDAEEYTSWMRNLTALKALAPILGEYELRSLAVEYSQGGSTKSKEKNSDPRYDPERIFDATQPTMPSEAAVGSLFAQARDTAAQIFRSYVSDCQREGATRDMRAVEAAVRYLCRYHPKRYEEAKRGGV